MNVITSIFMATQILLGIALVMVGLPSELVSWETVVFAVSAFNAGFLIKWCSEVWL